MDFGRAFGGVSINANGLRRASSQLARAGHAHVALTLARFMDVHAAQGAILLAEAFSNGLWAMGYGLWAMGSCSSRG